MMYSDLYLRMAKGIAPFHNKVLRFNYDLPLQDLTEIIKVIFETIVTIYKPGKVILFQDLIEYNGSLVDEFKEIQVPDLLNSLSSAEKLKHLYEESLYEENCPCTIEPGIRLGFSASCYDWYLRIFIEEECNLNPGEPLSGNIELYTTDLVIKAIAENGTVNQNGHLLVHGAKKYLEEIIAE